MHIAGPNAQYNQSSFSTVWRTSPRKPGHPASLVMTSRDKFTQLGEMVAPNFPV
jgi:hypothetical protein